MTEKQRVIENLKTCLSGIKASEVEFASRSKNADLINKSAVAKEIIDLTLTFLDTLAAQ